jgi:hypothetical protein
LGFDPQQRQERDFFSSPPPPDWLWGPPSFLSIGYWELFPQEKTSWGMKLYLHSAIHLHIMVLD